MIGSGECGRLGFTGEGFCCLRGEVGKKGFWVSPSLFADVIEDSADRCVLDFYFMVCIWGLSLSPVARFDSSLCLTILFIQDIIAHAIHVSAQPLASKTLVLSSYLFSGESNPLSQQPPRLLPHSHERENPYQSFPSSPLLPFVFAPPLPRVSRPVSTPALVPNPLLPC